MPARASSAVVPSLALHPLDRLAEHAAGVVDRAEIPTLTALIPAMPISLPGPVTGSSVPIVSTPSALARRRRGRRPVVGARRVGSVGGAVGGAVGAAPELRSPPSPPPLADSDQQCGGQRCTQRRPVDPAHQRPTLRSVAHERAGASTSVSGVSDEVERRQQLSTRDLVRWSEALAAIARTGLGFTQNLYERERFEEVLRVAADIKMAADEVLLAAEERREHAHLVEEWMESIGVDVPGYVTPKVAIGAVVGNDRGEILLVQRADSGFWLYPTGWADVGYSPAEVAVKEVAEETGIACEPEQLLAVIDGQRMGFSRFAMYMLLFHCTATGGELQPSPAWRPPTSVGSPRMPCLPARSERSGGGRRRSGRSAASATTPPSTASARPIWRS